MAGRKKRTDGTTTVTLTDKQRLVIDFALERTLGSPITTWSQAEIKEVEDTLALIRKGNR